MSSMPPMRAEETEYESDPEDSPLHSRCHHKVSDDESNSDVGGPLPAWPDPLMGRRSRRRSMGRALPTDDDVEEYGDEELGEEDIEYEVNEDVAQVVVQGKAEEIAVSLPASDAVVEAARPGWEEEQAGVEGKGSVELE